MSKEKKTHREGKKKPAMTLKEKRAAKRTKKEPGDLVDFDRKS